MRQNAWTEVGTLSFDKYFRSKDLDLSTYVSGAGKVKLRLVQTGGGAAHIDAALLGDKAPTEAKGIEDRLALQKLSKADFDVVDAFDKSIELVFPSGGRHAVLSLTARVEGTRISETPFQFPHENVYREITKESQFYRYPMTRGHGSRRDMSARPFFREYSPTGSGHPSGFTYGWVRNDDDNLYVTMDFTPDDTMDGEKDYAKVYVKGAEGVREFRVSVPETQWGSAAFTYTDKVAYQHKVYDFTIPLKSLELESGKTNELFLAFAAYGTASQCLPGDPCDDTDNDPCTEARCDQNGTCQQNLPAEPGTPCSAGNECLSDECNGDGTCGIPRTGADCTDTDDNVCTRALCDSAGTCDQDATDRGTRPCPDTDGDDCTEARCDGLRCDQDAPAEPGTPCSAGSECLSDECDGFGSCGIPRTGSDCTDTDGNVCTRALCDSAGTCDQQATDRGSRPCPDTDGDPCTVSRCNGLQCDQEADTASDGTSCDDGDACTVDDTCELGECSAGTPVSCDDGDACTLDRCDAGVCTCSADPTCAPQGCTPGYWKNNATKKSANAWPAPHTPSTKIGDVFTIPSCSGKLSGSLATSTLLQGLKFNGSTSLNGTAQSLLRSGIGALLNAASGCVQYPLCWNEVVDLVDQALASCTRSTMVSQIDQLEALNMLTCPLDQQGRCMN